MTERDDDVAWIEARERGAVRDHPRAAVYARLGQAIAALPELSGGDGWRAAVLDQLDQREVSTDALRRARAARARRRGMVAALASAVAIAAALFFLMRPRPAPPVAADLAYQVGAGDGARRSEGVVAIGQPLTIHASFAGAGQLWIYRGDRLAVRCPGGDGCASHAIPGGRRLEAALRTDVALTYTALLVRGAAAVPLGTLAADAEAAADAIAETLTIDVH